MKDSLIHAIIDGAFYLVGKLKARRQKKMDAATHCAKCKKEFLGHQDKRIKKGEVIHETCPISPEQAKPIE